MAAALHLHRRFNPHPPFLAGETPSLHLLRWSVACFNPHPPLLAGETLLFEQVDTPAVVSIHTRHYWRVKRLQRGVRPERQLVSIHTRHYWRVKRREEDPEMEIRLVSIHTRHYWRVKRRWPRAARWLRPGFNPHPPLLAGETRLGAAGPARRDRFNPHPPLLAGETARTQALAIARFFPAFARTGQ